MLKEHLEAHQLHLSPWKGSGANNAGIHFHNY